MLLLIFTGGAVAAVTDYRACLTATDALTFALATSDGLLATLTPTDALTFTLTATDASACD